MSKPFALNVSKNTSSRPGVSQALTRYEPSLLRERIGWNNTPWALSDTELTLRKFVSVGQKKRLGFTLVSKRLRGVTPRF